MAWYIANRDRILIHMKALRINSDKNIIRALDAAKYQRKSNALKTGRAQNAARRERVLAGRAERLNVALEKIV